MCGVEIVLVNTVPTNVLYESLELHLAHLEGLSIVIFAKGTDTMTLMSVFIMPKSLNPPRANIKLGKLMRTQSTTINVCPTGAKVYLPTTLCIKTNLPHYQLYPETYWAGTSKQSSPSANGVGSTHRI